jgi:hypothetical protein
MPVSSYKIRIKSSMQRQHFRKGMKGFWPVGINVTQTNALVHLLYFHFSATFLLGLLLAKWLMFFPMFTLTFFRAVVNPDTSTAAKFVSLF